MIGRLGRVIADLRGRPQSPRDFRIVAFLGHGSSDRVLVRGRVVDHVPPTEAETGEDAWSAVRRTVSRFAADALPGVQLTVSVGTARADVVSDRFGYFEAELDVELRTVDPGPSNEWVPGRVELAEPYRGIEAGQGTDVQIRVAGAGARFAVISDVDDTILLTGAQRLSTMLQQTFTGSHLTRTPFAGAVELYRAFADHAGAGHANPVFYVSSSPWPLHDFLTAFLDHRDFPHGPLLLRNLRGDLLDGRRTSHKVAHISELLRIHSDLPFVLVGDSGQRDPEIYAQVVRDHPGRVLAVYIREVRLDPGDGRVEAVADAWNEGVPFMLVGDSVAAAEHAAGIGLIAPDAVESVRRA